MAEFWKGQAGSSCKPTFTCLTSNLPLFLLILLSNFSESFQVGKGEDQIFSLDFGFPFRQAVSLGLFESM